MKEFGRDRCRPGAALTSNTDRKYWERRPERRGLPPFGTCSHFFAFATCRICSSLRCETTRAAATRHSGKTRYLSATPSVKAISASWEAALRRVHARRSFFSLSECARERVSTPMAASEAARLYGCVYHETEITGVLDQSLTPNV